MGYINSAAADLRRGLRARRLVPGGLRLRRRGAGGRLLRQQPAGRAARDAADLARGADRLRRRSGWCISRSPPTSASRRCRSSWCCWRSALFCFGLIMPNFNAIAMEPMGRIAGTASSFVGAVTTGVAAGLGLYVGQQYRRQRAAAGRGVRGVRRARARDRARHRARPAVRHRGAPDRLKSAAGEAPGLVFGAGLLGQRVVFAQVAALGQAEAGEFLPFGVLAADGDDRRRPARSAPPPRRRRRRR